MLALLDLLVSVIVLAIPAPVLTAFTWCTRVLVEGQIEISGNRVVRGMPARILGSILCATYLGVLLMCFILVYNWGGDKREAGAGTVYMGVAMLAIIIAIVFVKYHRGGSDNTLPTQTIKMPNVTINRIWTMAALRTYAKAQCVCLVVCGVVSIITDFPEQIRYEHHFYIRALNVYAGFLQVFGMTAIPVIVFSAIIPGLLIKRIRMQWPIWVDYVIVGTATISIVVIYLILGWIFFEPIASLPKAFRLIGAISIVVLPIGALGVLSCQRVLKKYIKDIAQPSASCDASRA